MYAYLQKTPREIKPLNKNKTANSSYLKNHSDEPRSRKPGGDMTLKEHHHKRLPLSHKR